MAQRPDRLTDGSEAEISAPRYAPRVAFIDDDPDLLNALRRALRGMDLGWTTSFYDDPVLALQALCNSPVDVAVVDIRMPEMNGVTLAGALAAQCPQTQSIVLSGSTDFDAAMSSINVGRIFRYLVKPCPTPDLVSAVQAALRTKAAAATPSDEALSAKAAIDLLKSGVLVLGRQGQVLFAIQRAGSLLARRDGLLVDSLGICRALVQEQTRALHKAIKAARDEGKSDAVTLNTDRHGPLRVVVRPSEDDTGLSECVVCLHLFAADDEPGVDPHLLRGMFGLTASESRLAAALSNGMSLEEASHAEGWTVNSAKSYLKSIFQKLGVSRQADLVRVVLRHAGR